jgi:hypothetical protein
MTAPTRSLNGEQAGLVQLLFPLAEAQQLESVLPWLLQALEDRPRLTENQRERRRATRAAIDGLLTQLRTGMQADASDQSQVANGMQPPR